MGLRIFRNFGLYGIFVFLSNPKPNEQIDPQFGLYGFGSVFGFEVPTATEVMDDGYKLGT